MFRFLSLLLVNSRHFISVCRDCIPQALARFCWPPNQQVRQRSATHHPANRQRREKRANQIYSVILERLQRRQLAGPQIHIVSKPIQPRFHRIAGNWPRRFREEFWRLALRPKPAPQIQPQTFQMNKILKIINHDSQFICGDIILQTQLSKIKIYLSYFDNFDQNIIKILIHL